ncbi:MAG: 3-hydroxyacyl-CoA [Beijerinckiaceae bacterium]|nr:MAG: 3-hydroxyacyl-CoA [Beijerinckiaceae bacterium]
MNTGITTRQDGRICIIEIDNPPVNAMSNAVRAALFAAVTAAAQDEGVDAIVLAGKGKVFCGGAEIREFGQPMSEPILPVLIDEIEGQTKPVIAALHGVAFGGGFEIALGAHFRVATRDIKLALPEVKLGLIPGAGGTQRLPRLIGLAKAARLIVTGEPVGAKDAEMVGLLDAVFDSDLLANALAFARKIVAEKTPIRRISLMTAALDASRADMPAFEDEVAALLKRARGLDAPAACVESIRNTLTMPFAEGLAREREIFVKLRDGEQSKAQRHLFFAERAALKVRGIPAETKARAIAKVAVLGAGTMGGGIAMCFASAGIPVTIIDPNPEALARGMGAVEANYRATAKRGGLSEAALARVLATLSASSDFNDVAGSDLIIEAVFEDMALKKTIFANLDGLAKPGAILATNTSSLDINEIASATTRPQDVLGLHFFSPANVMRLLEIVRAEKTAPDVLVSAMEVARRIGKVPVTVGVCYGFVGNRMLHARGGQVERLLLEGASPADIDAAATGFGFAMGPCAVGDLAGLDVGWRIRKERGTKAIVADAICELGRFGQKTGKGYFRYEAGSRTPLPDPEVEALIVRLAAEHARRTIGQQEVLDRLILPLVNEGARILDEGIAERSSDIDLIWINGYGFPVGRGGPMFHADSLGLAKVAERLDHYAAITADEKLRPAPLIVRLAAGGKSFESLPQTGG